MTDTHPLQPSTWPDPWRRRAPWVAPGAAVAVVAVAALAPAAFAANPHPTLPARTAAQLIAAVEGSTVRALSGTVVSTPALGLPQLPGSDGGDQLTTFLTERSSYRLWVDGQDRQRIALLGTGQETDLVRDGSSVWTWASATQDATHDIYRVPADADEAQPETALSPAAAGAKALAAIDPSTQVSVGPTARVAGRSAYTLVLQPRTPATLVGKLVVDIDAASGVPLGVQLFGRGSSTPAFGEQFSQVSLTTPPASEFAFTPPPGAHVTTHADSAPAAQRAAGTTSEPTVVGEGWAAVLVIPPSATSSSLTGAASVGGGGRSSSSLLRDATDPTATGRVVQTRLVSVLFTTGGRILVGAVPASRLEAIAAGLSGP